MGLEKFPNVDVWSDVLWIEKIHIHICTAHTNYPVSEHLYNPPAQCRLSTEHPYIEIHAQDSQTITLPWRETETNAKNQCTTCELQSECIQHHIDPKPTLNLLIHFYHQAQHTPRTSNNGTDRHHWIPPQNPHSLPLFTPWLAFIPVIFRNTLSPFSITYTTRTLARPSSNLHFTLD